MWRDHIKSAFGPNSEYQGLYGTSQITPMNLMVISSYIIGYVKSRMYLVEEINKTWQIVGL